MPALRKTVLAATLACFGGPLAGAAPSAHAAVPALTPQAHDMLNRPLDPAYGHDTLRAGDPDTLAQRVRQEMARGFCPVGRPYAQGQRFGQDGFYR